MPRFQGELEPRNLVEPVLWSLEGGELGLDLV